MIDFEHNPQQQSSIHVNLYADEIKPIRNSRGEKWMYIGVLAIPENKQDTILCCLEQDRYKTKYFRTLHYSDITNHTKYQIAYKWLDRVKYDKWKDPIPPAGSKGFFFHILGINFSNLQHQVFGDSGSRHEDNIYNRFFRSAISYLLLSCFGKYDHIKVLNIYHHASHLKNRIFFNWHSIFKVNHSYDKIRFHNQQIVHIDTKSVQSDPKGVTEFIQLIDLILGSGRMCFDFTSKRKWQIKTAQTLRPLFASLTDKYRQKEQRKYYLYNRCSLSFFPSRKLSTNEIDDKYLRASSRFYRNRPILLPPEEGDSQQLILDL